VERLALTPDAIKRVLDASEHLRSARIGTGLITAEAIRERAAKDIEQNAPKPTEKEIRALARETVFKIVTEQMPHLSRKVRRELAKRYEAERWQAAHSECTSTVCN